MSKETKIYLIRHGAVENPNDISYGRLPVPLSAEGKRQMRGLCEIFKAKGIKFDAIYTSPVQRAIQSAKIICDQLSVKILELSDDLNDVDVGELEGGPMQILKDAEYSEENLRDMGYIIESKSAMVKRVSRLIEEVIQKHKGETVALISHGDLTRLALWSQEFPQKAPPKNLRDADYLAVSEAVVLRFDGDRFIGREFIRRDSGQIESDNIRRTEAY